MTEKTDKVYNSVIDTFEAMRMHRAAIVDRKLTEIPTLGIVYNGKAYSPATSAWKYVPAWTWKKTRKKNCLSSVTSVDLFQTVYWLNRPLPPLCT